MSLGFIGAMLVLVAGLGAIGGLVMLIGPEALITAADTDDVQVATLAFGVGNWYLVRGDKAQARAWFERSIKSGGWPGFGFILSEVELQRLR
jgi:hypothetical protein